ncbi:MAG: imidazole glycerol phosphate synthase subunit HisH [Bacteroidota bacterium]
MKVSIIKYNAGNVQSVLFALERIGINAIVTDDIDLLRSSDKIILPGVGEASSAMSYLKERKLDQLIISLTQPVLGICLGMQLMCRYSEEGNTNCLGIFENKVKRFSGNFKVPQIGWNNIYDLNTDLYKSVQENEYMYFVHSYYAELGEYTIAKTNYGSVYSSSLQKNNFYAAQFHPEKSGDAGQKILENFIKL